jgi:hypothetical protein
MFENDSLSLRILILEKSGNHKVMDLEKKDPFGNAFFAKISQTDNDV